MRHDPGTDGLALDSLKIEKLDLPTATKTLLVSEGLPHVDELGLTFLAEDGTFPTLNAICAKKDWPPAREGDTLYRIGESDSYQICLTMGEGTVVAIEVGDAGERKFVNSSLALFLNCLELCSSFYSQIEDLDEDAIPGMAERTAIALTQIDVAAAFSEQSWWGPEIDELGLL